ncbi:hypothetical protein TNCV_3842701 [Trichonephila clavipes]|nr:hypothetical protein TNCV_3842701 [Trichonephila clavipes]
MKSKHRAVCVAPEDLSSLAVEAKEKRNRFEQTSRKGSAEENIDVRPAKDQLVKKDVLVHCEAMTACWRPSGSSEEVAFT